MGALWAIITDTWHQSRQQVVFLIMLGLLALLAVAPPLVASPVTHADEDGVEAEHIRLFGQEESEELLEGTWGLFYAQSVMFEDSGGEIADPMSEEGQQLQRDMLEGAEIESSKSPKQRGVEVILFIVSGLIFSVSMMLFIAAASGYFPSMLEAGGSTSCSPNRSSAGRSIWASTWAAWPCSPRRSSVAT